MSASQPTISQSLPAGSLITVFGASGFIGRYVVRALTKAGYRVRAAVRRPGEAHFLRTMGVVGQVQIAQANIRYKKTIEDALEGASGVVNLVGVLSESGRQSFEAVQARAPGIIAEAAAAAGISHFVHVSALGADLESASKYARTKAEGEQAVRAAMPEAVIMRPSIVFGQEDAFFNRFAEMARLSPVLPLFGGGQNRLQPVYVCDVAEAIFRALTDPAHAGQTFELGGPNACTFEELMKDILSVTQRNRLLLPLPILAAKAVALVTWPIGLLFEPPLTFDQIHLLQVDNIVAAETEAKTLDDLGLVPTGHEIILPSYLVRFRKTGQYAGTAAA